MAFQVKKVSNHGTANPIVARLTFQTNDLIQFCQIDKDVKDKILALYHGEVQPNLLECDDLASEIAAEILEVGNKLERNGFSTQSGGRVIEVPYIIRLDQRVKQFLYSAKSALRDLSKVFGLFFGKEFNEPRYDKVLKWSLEKFGADNELSRIIKQDHDLWIKKIVTMRNAVEHPGGHSGTLNIQNFCLIPENHPEYPKIEEPTWNLNNEPRVSIAKDLLSFVANMLEFCEDVLVICMRLKGLPDMVRVAEIPEKDRANDCPIRLRMVVNHKKIEHEEKHGDK